MDHFLHLRSIQTAGSDFITSKMKCWRSIEKTIRYVECIEKLAEMQNRKVHYKIFERPGLVNVQSFDVFYSDFAGIIRDIVNEMNEDGDVDNVRYQESEYLEERES